jgi:hypothetical protein
MKILVDLQWKLIVFLRVLHFPSMRLLHIIDLKTRISLKDLDYRVTSPGSVHTSILILTSSGGKLSIIQTLAHIS